MAAKKKQLEIQNKLLFPNLNKENNSYPQQSKAVSKFGDGFESPGQDSAHLRAQEALTSSLKKPIRNGGTLRKDNGSPGMQMSPHQ